MCHRTNILSFSVSSKWFVSQCIIILSYASVKMHITVIAENLCEILLNPIIDE